MTRYENYPKLARMLRAMTPEGRELVAHWHRVLITGLEAAIPKLSRSTTEAMDSGRFSFTASEKAAIIGAAKGALEAWLAVMRDVAGLIVDHNGDWCCKPGMLAYPDPCPQHGWNPAKPGHTSPGLIIERMLPGESDRERCVAVGAAEGPYWVSVQAGTFYDGANLRECGPWVVVGRV